MINYKGEKHKKSNKNDGHKPQDNRSKGNKNDGELYRDFDGNEIK